MAQQLKATVAPEVIQQRIGGFWWVDLVTTDVADAKRFYGELMGWTFDDMPMEEGSYTFCLIDGHSVGAMYPQGNEMRDAGMPPMWQSYLTVADVDAATKRAQELGGKAITEPFDVMDVGRMSIITDPTGAPLNLWQIVTHPGAEVTGEPGSLCWTELLTTNVGAAGAFLTALVGWSSEPAGDSYVIFKAGETMKAGMMEITPQMGGVPPSWLSYFMTADLDDSLVRVGQLGGRVNMPATEMPGGRFAVVADPQGATFGLWERA